jgi:dGTPase
MAKDHREQFERDYDRALFSTPVKRLQDKAQVFPLDPHDAVRTRLTHSLEVSTVARGLTIAAGQWLLKKGAIASEMERQIEAIAAACGLIHDLGNPPFGHAGEEAIRGWFADIGEEKLRKELEGNEQCVQDLLKFERECANPSFNFQIANFGRF